MRKLLFGLMAILVFSTTSFASVDQEVEERPPDIGITDLTYDIDVDVIQYADMICYNLPDVGIHTIELKVEIPEADRFISPVSFYLVKQYTEFISKIESPPNYSRSTCTEEANCINYSKPLAIPLHAIRNDLPIDPGWRFG